jgi:hypothetical protein
MDERLEWNAMKTTGSERRDVDGGRRNGGSVEKKSRRAE